MALQQLLPRKLSNTSEFLILRVEPLRRFIFKAKSDAFITLLTISTQGIFIFQKNQHRNAKSIAKYPESHTYLEKNHP